MHYFFSVAKISILELEKVKRNSKNKGLIRNSIQNEIPVIDFNYRD